MYVVSWTCLPEHEELDNKNVKKRANEVTADDYGYFAVKLKLSGVKRC